MRTDLKPCPFCGGKADVAKEAIPYQPTLYWVECGNDNCEVNPSTYPVKSLDSAVVAWNRRSTDENI